MLLIFPSVIFNLVSIVLRIMIRLPLGVIQCGILIYKLLKHRDHTIRAFFCRHHVLAEQGNNFTVGNTLIVVRINLVQQKLCVFCLLFEHAHRVNQCEEFFFIQHTVQV